MDGGGNIEIDLQILTLCDSHGLQNPSNKSLIIPPSPHNFPNI